jgi:hypothetical protein
MHIADILAQEMLLVRFKDVMENLIEVIGINAEKCANCHQKRVVE